MIKRFQIRMDPQWRPFLLLGGATRSNSFVEVGKDYVAFNFGFAFHYRIDRSEIKAVFRRSWPFWYGIGWRTNLRGVIGLVGSYEDVVEVRLNTRKRAWALFPMDRIGVSLEDPQGFIDAFPEFTNGAQPRSKKPSSVRQAAPASKPRARTGKAPGTGAPGRARRRRVSG